MDHFLGTRGSSVCTAAGIGIAALFAFRKNIGLRFDVDVDIDAPFDMHGGLQR
jgi:hypothetical protein